MFDLNYLKKTYSESTTEKLTELFLIKQRDLLPAALSVLKEELQKRGVEINHIYEKEISKSPPTEFLISNALDSNAKNNIKVTGDLYLTSESICFIPVKFINPGLCMYWGLLGIVLNDIKNKLFMKKEGTMENGKDIPPALLAKHVKDSCAENIDNVKSIIYGKTGSLRMVIKDGKVKDFNFDKKKVFMLETWLNAHGIKHEISERLFGLMYLT